MITILPLILLVLWYANKLNVIKSKYFLFNICFAIIIVYCSFLEIFALSPGNYFPRLDEEFFYLEASQDLKSLADSNWRYLIYNLFSHATIATGTIWMLKIQSVPFVFLTALVLLDATNNKKILLYFPFFFGYLYVLSTLNMRDSMLLCSMLFFMHKVSRANNFTVFLWSSLAVGFYLLLRPEYALIWCLLFMWTICGRCIKSPLIAYILPAVTAITVFVLFETDLYNLINLVYPDRIDVYLQARSDELAEIPFLNENASAIVRQLITPLPTSKLVALLFNGPTDNLVIIEVFRIILMSGVYFMIFALLIHPKKAVTVFIENRFLHLLFTFSVINTILYSIYGAGGGDSRNKIYPYILIYIIFVEVIFTKSKQTCGKKFAAYHRSTCATPNFSSTVQADVVQ